MNLNWFSDFLFFPSSPGCFSRCNDGSLVSFAVGVRVEKHVALQTQPLDTCGALSVNRGNPTDAAGLCRETNTQRRQVKATKTHVVYWTPVSKLIWRTIFGFLYFISLVSGSGGVAVIEVIARVTEWLIGTRRANDRRRAAAQITVARCRRGCAWRRDRRRYQITWCVRQTNPGREVWRQLTCRWFQGSYGARSWFRRRSRRLEFGCLLLLCRRDDHSVTHWFVLEKKPASLQSTQSKVITAWRQEITTCVLRQHKHM